MLREIDIEPEALFDVENQCSLARNLSGLALALTLGLTIICSLKHSEVVIYVRLNECLAAAPSFDERFNMRPIICCSRFAFETKLVLPFDFDGWNLIELWLRHGFRLYERGRLVVSF